MNTLFHKMRLPRPASFAGLAGVLTAAACLAFSPASAQAPDEDDPGHAYLHALEGGYPDSPKKRAKVLGNLYAHLAAAPDARTGNEVAAVIERIWLMPGSATIQVLMERAAEAINNKDANQALKFLDAVVELAPDYPEGWNRRALAYYMKDDFTRAMGDLRRTLALEPNHFKAMQGLGQLLKDVGKKKAALEAYRKLLEVHPFVDGGADALREIEREVEGQGI